MSILEIVKSIRSLMEQCPLQHVRQMTTVEVDKLAERMESLCARAHDLEITSALARELLDWTLSLGMPTVGPHATWLIHNAIGRHSIEDVVARHEGWTLHDLECGCGNHAPYAIINPEMIRRNHTTVIISITRLGGPPPDQE